MEFLRYIFGFDSDSPLLFTQFYFWAFFALVYSVFAIIMEVGSRGAQNGYTMLKLKSERQELSGGLH